MSDDFSNDSMLELYLFEATGLLDSLDDILLQSEKNNDLTEENINEIFRIMHTIKGSSAMMTFDLISKVSHKVEDLFTVIRKIGIPENKFEGLFDLVLKVSDFLKDEIKKIQNSIEPTTDDQCLLAEIQKMTDSFSENTKADSSEKNIAKSFGEIPHLSNTDSELSKTANPITQVESAINEPSILEENLNTHFLHVYFSEGSKMENIRAFILVNKLGELGTVNKFIPSDLENNADSANYIIENGFYVSFTTKLSREEIENISKGTLSVETVSFMKKMPDTGESDYNEGNAHPQPESIDTLQDDTHTVEETEQSSDNAEANNIMTESNVEESGKEPVAKNEDTTATKTPAPLKQNLINVNLTKLDDLMDIVGEIVITESMVTENPDLQDLKLDNFRKSARQLNKLTDELQDIVMSVRLVPISSVFHRMRRIMRDMSKDLNKKAELVLIGENTEVDKTILDTLADPIMHLVRNAMDHAIESPEERKKAGKSAEGHVILSAQNMGGDIIISISDDGKGLDPEKILERAASQNLLTKPQSEYTDKEIFNFLMAPGFSTKDQVTEYSGRGVGMDVVKMNIQNIGGSVIIESVKGLGTNIFLKIPVTLAIIPCMEIKVGKDVYCLPINNIKESFKASAGKMIKDPDDNEMIMLRGSVYPVIALHDLYHVEDAVTDIDDAILILVDSGDRMACLIADELIGKSQVVVKPIPPYLREFDVKGSGISGCTIMGDGSISLILDVMEILS